MHWVDMQWLWGYHVLPGSVADMLHLCRRAGVRGNVNFDAVGYEKMAAECPGALAELRDAVREGIIEPVGCSYGQPYALFQGGESNVRQLTFGVRTTLRLLGARPRSFWEEEFYFFPQLPQLLAQCGYTGACLFFQWTWHTPEVPREPTSLILWEGLDGTRLPTLPRNDLNVHQWPEDFDGLLEKAEAPGTAPRAASGGGSAAAPQARASANPGRHGSRPRDRRAGSPIPPTGPKGTVASAPPPAIVQWLELMPSRDWMCRSELLLPRLEALMADRRFEIRPRTMGELIAELSAIASDAAGRRAAASASNAALAGAPWPLPGAPPVPIRRYTMDDVWHGMTLGKNADRHPRTSAEVERLILAAESSAATASLFGRPYASWDVYPTWELEEAWRELLAAQHHDNHECEGLCGFVGYHSLDRARSLAAEVHSRTSRLIASRAGAPVELSHLGWPTEMPRVDRRSRTLAGGPLPPFGYAGDTVHDRVMPRTRAKLRGTLIVLERGGLSVEIDRKRGLVRQIRSGAFPDGVLDPASPLLALACRRSGSVDPVALNVRVEADAECVSISRSASDGSSCRIHVRLALLDEAIDIEFAGVNALGRPDAGLNAALQLPIQPAFRVSRLIADAPFSAQEVRGFPEGRRKYPAGDWMTSPQWFEAVKRPFTSSRFVDLLDDRGRGLLILHNGSQQWLREARGVRAVLNAYDPWDEARYEPHDGRLRFRLISHGTMTSHDRAKAALAFGACGNDRASPQAAATGKPDLPPLFGPLSVEGAPNVLAQAFYRESMKSGEHLPLWAGHRMFAESGGACDHPFVIRLVEWDGKSAEVTLKLAGPVAMAAKATVLGEVRAGEPATPGERTGRHRAPGSSDAALLGNHGGWSWADTGWLRIERATPPDWSFVNGTPIAFRGKPIPWSQVRFTMRPHEIATIYADMVMGRKQWRDLDAKRKVWATVHRRQTRRTRLEARRDP